jgi:hypothetical protein
MKELKDYCFQVIATHDKEDEEIIKLRQMIKEQKKQKHRLFEQLLESERSNEILQMRNEELRTIAQ